MQNYERIGSNFDQNPEKIDNIIKRVIKNIYANAANKNNNTNHQEEIQK